MPLFRNNNDNLVQIGEISFKMEKEIQKITEKNLDKIFGLEFVQTEFQLGRFRIDTLAFDKESSNFVIIEYKKDRNSGLFDQGLAYLEIMLDRRADFITEYNENLNKNLKKKDVDWSQSKIIFVSTSFNKNQKQAVNLDLHIELWQVNSYENGIIEYMPILINETKTPMNILGPKDSTINKITREIKTYDEEYHFKTYGSKKIEELYHEIKSQISALGNDIKPIFRKKYIAFKSNSNFAYLKLRRNMIHVDLILKINEISDPKHILRDMDGIGNHGGGHSRITIKDSLDIHYIMFLINQSYTKSIKIRKF